MNIEIGDKALITTEGWFRAPDGVNYRAVFGTIKAVLKSEDALGVKTNAKSTNWYVEIGNMTVAGCQIHYAIKTDKCSKEPALSWSSSAEHGLKEFNTPCAIYFADED